MENELTATIIGHTSQRNRLRQLWNTNKLPSALMFTGASGIGKSLVAKELYQSAFCEKQVYGGCHNCASCTLFEAHNHPDFYERDFLDKDNTTVESLRDLLYSLHHATYKGGARVILFHNSELMSINGANLLLKIIEEPRPNTYFCLLTSTPSRIIPTILSRCHKWFFDKLSESEISRIIHYKNLAPNIPEKDLILLADGTLENLTSLESNYNEWQELCNTLDKIAKGDLALANTFVTDLNKDRESLRTKLRMMTLYVRSKMIHASNKTEQDTWSICLTNLLDSEPLIFERNIGANYILSLLFIDLAEHLTNPNRPKESRLLQDIVI